MSELIRFGVSIEADLLEKFDAQITQRGYGNRSEAIRDLIRDNLVQDEWDADAETIGTITLVYDHHTRELTQKMTHIQHSFTGEIRSSLHIHLDHSNCLEVIVVQGKGHLVETLANELISLKGVKHGKLTGTTTGAALPSKPGHHIPGHEHPHGRNTRESVARAAKPRRRPIR